MTFTKAMIDLAKEIRRRAPSEDKPSLKLANPDLFVELADLFHRTNDAVMTALIKEICDLADEPWHSILEQPNNTGNPSILTYRGQSRLVASSEPKAPETSGATPKRIYRGQVVHSA